MKSKTPTGDYLDLVTRPKGYDEDEIRQQLFFCLNRRNVVALCGAGCSKQLGYPDWDELVLGAIDSKKSLASADPLNSLRHFENLSGYVDSRPLYLDQRTILSFLEPDKKLDTIRKTIQETFLNTHNQITSDDKTGDIYQALIGLDIRRFVTTNFDFEIERALAKSNKVPIQKLLPDNENVISEHLPADKLKPFRSGNSFTQGPDCMEQLSRFSLASNPYSNYMVFHCHGRFDDIQNCILTESDYQEWYLRDSRKVKAFKQTMDLLFGSNPLLVIGYSLRDPELGQILRTVHAKRANDPIRSPLFLLLYLKGKVEERRDQCLALNKQYGAYVIPLNHPLDEIQAATLDELKLIGEGWQAWRARIIEKPKVRSFKMHQARDERKYFHYLYADVEQGPFIETVAYQKLKQELNNLANEKKIRCALLIGKAGSGKTWSMQRVCLDWIERAKAEKTGRIFFWSSYYSADLYNGLKRAIKFFTDQEISHVRPDQIWFLFQEILEKEKDSVLVFDGIERLLKQTKHLARGERLNAGKPINLDVRDFFDKILNNKGPLVLLTSRILPQQFAKPIAQESVALLGNQDFEKQNPLRKRRSLRRETRQKENQRGEFFADGVNAGEYSPLRITAENLKDWETLGHLLPEDRTELCARVSGHLYSLCLLERMLSPIDDDEEHEKLLASVIENITNTPTDRRRERVVREAIEIADKYRLKNSSTAGTYQPPYNLLAKFLELVALFMSPVEEPALKTCWRLADGRDVDFEGVITYLKKRALLLEVKFNNIGTAGFTVHSLVQSYVRRHVHRSAFSIHPSMILPGYTSDFDVVDPGEGKDSAKKLFERLCDDANEQVKKRNHRAAGAAVRAAFGILRSRFCSNTVSRWGNYRDYLEMVYGLRDTAKHSTNGLWSLAETIEDPRIYDTSENLWDPPLYLGELAWLQNEAGLATYTEGNMLDSMFMRQQSFEINSILDGKLPGFHKFQSYFNVGSVFIDLGNLPQARRYLDQALLIAGALEDKGLTGRVLGYLGWLAYLQGNFEDAEKDLKAAIQMVKSNARAKSVLLTFYAQLLLASNRNQEAQHENERARALAEGAHYPDLIAYAHLGIGDVLRNKPDHVNAKREYELVLDRAREFRLRRLEASALRSLSHWSYGLHDSEAACHYAIRALTIANESSLGLHQTDGLLAFGNALLLANQENLGKAYLKSARELGKHQGYFLRSTEADVILRGIGEERGQEMDFT